MKWTTDVSNLIKEVELRKNPVIIRVNKFTEDSAKKFQMEMAQAQKDIRQKGITLSCLFNNVWRENFWNYDVTA